MHVSWYVHPVALVGTCMCVVLPAGAAGAQYLQGSDVSDLMQHWTASRARMYQEEAWLLDAMREEIVTLRAELARRDGQLAAMAASLRQVRCSGLVDALLLPLSPLCSVLSTCSLALRPLACLVSSCFLDCAGNRGEQPPSRSLCTA